MDPSPHTRRHAVTFVVCFAAVLLGQWSNNAYNGELAGDYDESAHYVTTLMVRQFALDPLQAPMPFAENYYLHYPKVGLGHWPPMLYILLAAWSIPFGASQASMLVGVAVMAAATAALLFSLARPAAGVGLAAGITALWLAQPAAQQAAATVMAESLLTLLCLASIASFQKLLDTDSWRWGALFGLLAASALLTKGTAISLALVPPLAVILAGRVRLLLQWKFWLPAAIVLVLAGPWYFLAGSFIPSAHGSAVNRVVNLAPLDTPSERATTYFTVGGAWISGAIALGFAAALVGLARRREGWLQLSAAAAFLVAACATHFALPESQSPRHLSYALPAGLLLTAAGLGAVSRLRGAPGRVAAWALLAVVFGGFWMERFQLFHKPVTGMREALEFLGERALEDDAILLVGADSLEEGALIAEIVEHRPTPGPVVLRASKVLAMSSWGGWNYSMRMENEEELADYLRRTQARTVVVGGSPPARAAEHYHLLVRTLESRPEQWELSYAADDRPIRIFRALEQPPGPRPRIEIDMKGRLRKTLELSPEAPRPQ